MEYKLKRVRIRKDNIELLESLSKMAGKEVSDYLDDITNKAIQRQIRIIKEQNSQPLFVWKN